ncbi:ABC transporter permease [Klebsiella aerogenes]|uniref:ABC transporter permease n=1 Tax=Klebsiella aerogenes TaxID=548 RepID=UPI0005061C89|nr:ABC transporter permease [Klebsiella aerogenes]EIV6644747.1 ABC transporter permease [Klebsiella aerogenes]EKT3980573.1 ABC transporter permease [Klebsiella aerogenes]ELA0148623.1 ABC transporter permease [Klebsiella aerogenes]KGB04829.1 ABC-2 type transporter family protein [Klebsiella aerogenes]KLE49900.1 sugar ABC transporter permease [Klebsiella aerogenes]
MQNSFSSSPWEIVRTFVRHRKLIINLTRREITGRYKGSLFGILWSFFNPIFMLVVYTFVFSFIFNARWSVESTSKAEFALVLFAGLIVFNFFSECAIKAPGTILSNVNYVKKVIFPLEILPIVNALSVLFHACVSISVWLIFYIIEIGFPHVTVLLFPIFLLPLFVFVLGIGWLLSSLGVFLRDVGQLISIFVTALMFLSPIFYPVTAIPEKYRPLLNLNPLAPAISQFREIFYWGTIPSMSTYATYLFGCALFAWFGFIVFQKTRKGFADVL